MIFLTFNQFVSCSIFYLSKTVVGLLREYDFVLLVTLYSTIAEWDNDSHVTARTHAAIWLFQVSDEFCFSFSVVYLPCHCIPRYGSR